MPAPRSALEYGIRRFINSKQSSLKNQNGFFYRFYELSKTISPFLATCFLLRPSQQGAPKGVNLKQLVAEFQKDMTQYAVDIFSFKGDKYQSMEQLQFALLNLTLTRYEEMVGKLQ
eukprot:TRINITY_DN3940_c0_g1_i3.p2 TRINITY_DN3940_c0_g1~~TRINITY_DN3940_c0_g1_i3.p2  ORF type:complete len:116 (-),score=38.99 TRINITY_DN3940_c0_g1_i3:233-580(-)